MFVYYCDYSLDKGCIFVKQASFVKLLKDAMIIDDRRGRPWPTVTEQEVVLLLSRELNNPLLKALDFQSFLNMLVKLALLQQHKASR